MSYQVKAADVAKLRNATGAGMMDCKKALVEAEGDFDKAVEILRKKGQKVAAKRADRDSHEGAVLAVVNDDSTEGAAVSLNCETDFVAKNEDFVALAEKLANLALDYNTKDELLAAEFYDGMNVGDKLLEQTGVIGEKIEIGTFEKLSAPYVGAYTHNGNKLAALVGLNKNFDNAEEVAKNVAMHVVAMNPVALNEDGVDQSTIDKEVEIAKDQLRQEGKPEEMLDNIAKGKIKKFFKENTLVNQGYMGDNKESVTDYLKSQGDDVEVVGYVRASV